MNLNELLATLDDCFEEDVRKQSVQLQKSGDSPIDSLIILSHLRHELSRLTAEKGRFMSVNGKI